MKVSMKIGLLAAAMAGAMGGLCAPASSTAFDITLSGTIATGADDRGLFGPAHRSLGGDAFTIHYVLDPVSMVTTTDADGVSPLYRFDTAGKMRIEIKINDRIFSFTGAAQSVYQKTDHVAAGGQPAFSRIDFQGYDGTNSIAESVTADDAPLGPLVTFPAGSLGHSSLNLSLFGGAVRASSVDNILISTVPEPASWTLMLTGFGVIGAVMRQRRALRGFGRRR